jgi:hypothetical protein
VPPISANAPFDVLGSHEQKFKAFESNSPYLSASRNWKAAPLYAWHVVTREKWAALSMHKIVDSPVD